MPFDEGGGDGTDHIRIGTEGTILASHVEPVADINVGDDAEVDINTEIAELSCEPAPTAPARPWSYPARPCGSLRASSPPGAG